jgi:hypothetical protein
MYDIENIQQVGTFITTYVDSKTYNLYHKYSDFFKIKKKKAFQVLVCRRVQRYLNDNNIPSQIFTGWKYKGDNIDNIQLNEPTLSKSYDEEIKDSYDQNKVYIKNKFMNENETLNECYFSLFGFGRVEPPIEQNRRWVFTCIIKNDSNPNITDSEQIQRGITIVQAFEEAIKYLLEIKSKTADLIPLLKSLSEISHFEAEPARLADADADDTSEPPAQIRRLEGMSQSDKKDALNILALRQMMYLQLPPEARGRHDATPKQMLDNLKLNLNN